MAQRDLGDRLTADERAVPAHGDQPPSPALLDELDVEPRDVRIDNDDVVAVGSGGSYALAAARALLKYTELSAEEVVRESLSIAAEIDIYTNDQITVEELKA